MNSLDPGPMRVAGNDHVNSAGYGIQLEFIDIVEDVDRTPAEPYHLGVGITFHPVAGIDIPSDRNHRRNLAESGDDVRPADVTGVSVALQIVIIGGQGFWCNAGLKILATSRETICCVTSS